MRPIEKGDSPYMEIASYQEAFPYLERRLGNYCSFCEMRVNNALAVEHKESKNSGGALTKWENLLLSCTYRNSRKGEKVKKGQGWRWLWPDEHNTFLAFSYEGEVPKINEEYLQRIGEEALNRAKALFEDLALDYRPCGKGKGIAGKKKDKRWERRFEALSVAEHAKQDWDMLKDTEFRERQLHNIENLAKGYGFFSIWMMVFREEPEIKKSLIQIFPGTAGNCFDEEAIPVRRPESILGL